MLFVLKKNQIIYIIENKYNFYNFKIIQQLNSLILKFLLNINLICHYKFQKNYYLKINLNQNEFQILN